MIESEKKYIYASIILTGEGLNPTEVTEKLKLKPTKSFKCGDYRNKNDTWKNNFWSLESKDIIQTSDLASHIEWLINQIEPVKNIFIDIVNKQDINSEIACFWILPTDHEIFTLKGDLIKKISDIGIKLEIDVYSP